MASWFATGLTSRGNVTLASGSKIDVDRTQGSNAVFRNGDRFNIITAGGSITDSGVQVASHSSFPFVYDL